MELHGYLDYFGEKTKRKIRVLDLLTEKMRTAKELADYIPNTAKTLTEDIKNLNYELTMLDNGNVKMYKTESTATYRLIGVTPILKHQLFLNYVESSTEFRIYQYLLNPSLKNDLGGFLKSVHIGYSPFYSFTPKLRKLFKEFDFQLETMKDGIKGDELNIRFFFLNFYWEIFKGLKWPFQDILEKKCLDQASKLEEITGNKLTQHDQKKLTYFLAICLIRKELDSQLVIPEKVRKILMHPIFKRDPKICASIENMVSFLNSESMAIVCIWYLLPSIGISLFKHKEKLKEFSYFVVSELKTEWTADYVTISENLENKLQGKVKFDFHIHFVQLLLFEEKMALRLFIKEIESFYFRFIGENYWIKEENYIKRMEKEFNLILWMKEQLYRRKVKIKIDSKYGKRLEEALKGQLILGAESWIEWVASTSTEEACDIVLTDQIFLLESKSENYFYLTFPLGTKQIDEFKIFFWKTVTRIKSE